MYAEQLPDGRVKYGSYYKDPLTGKKRKVTITYDKDSRTNRIHAQETLSERVRALEHPQEYTDANLTLKTLSERYLRYQRDNVKMSTWKRNSGFVASTNRILGEDVLVDRLTSDYVREAFRNHCKTAGAFNERLERFKAMWRWAYQQEYVDSTKLIDRIKPMKDVPHKAKIQDKYLERDELKLLLNEMSQPIWRDLTEFMALSGLRFGEAAALTADDVDLTERYIHVRNTLDSVNKIVTDTKTWNSQRGVFIQSELLPLVTLLVRRSGGGLLFQDENGGYIEYYAFNKYLKENSKVCLDRTITTHALRHTHCSLCAEAGMELDAISRRLGHGDSRITKEIYFHVTKRMQEKENAAMDRVNILHEI